MTQKEATYMQNVAQRMREAFEGADRPPKPFSLETGRLVLFSDLHRGGRDRADDFRRCERAYNAALAYYFHSGYTLGVLGDAEELWKERPRTVIRAYSHSLGLEKRFHDEGRYIRVWGNHDDAWQAQSAVDQHLGAVFGALRVPEAVRLEVTDAAGMRVGTLLLAHGHQGTTASDRYTRLARLPVRYVWRPFQRLTGVSLNTPAQDWELRERHNQALHAAIQPEDALVLIAGHTHRPVFESRSHAVTLVDELEKARRDLEADPSDSALRTTYAETAAELEWVRAQEQQRSGPEGHREAGKPCYFNTGCCCFSDGKITGLEIADGEIRLVRWPDDTHAPKPKVLAHAPLRPIFDRCRNGVPALAIAG